jgi:hypothetical protein
MYGSVLATVPGGSSMEKCLVIGVNQNSILIFFGEAPPGAFSLRAGALYHCQIVEIHIEIYPLARGMLQAVSERRFLG